MINGMAGTGKSYLAREIMDDLRSNGKTVAIIAPTNAAALNAGGDEGRTFHRFFCLNGSRISSKFRKRGNVPDVIWVDESSMVTEQMWEALYTLYRMYGKDSGCGSPIQYIITGDPDQCAPIDFGDRSRRAFGVRETTFYECPFIYEMVDHVTTLVTPHRSCDPVWTQICGVIRDGGEWVASDSIGVDDLGFLMCDDHSKPKVICYTNNVRKMINRRCSQRWPTVLMTDPLPFYKNDGEKK